eukprot:Skav223083  [mRNA]  locus=scaffold419:262165:263094:- [translate_table: standard]
MLSGGKATPAERNSGCAALSSHMTCKSRCSESSVSKRLKSEGPVLGKEKRPRRQRRNLPGFTATDPSSSSLTLWPREGISFDNAEAASSF